MKCITVNPNNTDLHYLLIGLLSTDFPAFRLLQKYLPIHTDGASIPAYAFIANICKEHSYVELALQLYKECIFTPYIHMKKYIPMNYILNYTHMLEVLHSPGTVLEKCMEYLQFDATYVQGGGQGGANRLLPLVLAIPSIECITHNQDPILMPAPSHQYSLRWEPIPSSTSPGDKDHRAIVTIITPAKDVCASATPTVLPCITAPGSGELRYTEEEIDTLAMLFTVIKIIYLSGGSSFNTANLALLYHRIDPWRLLSHVSLHTTSIRNEYAYYLAIGHLLDVACGSDGLGGVPGMVCAYSPRSTKGNEMCVSGRHRTVFVVGDSHVLPYAGYTHSTLSDSVQYIPLLVTGVKQYHLRGAPPSKNKAAIPSVLLNTHEHSALERSDFYTKASFYSYIYGLPDHSEVDILGYC